MYAPRDTPRRKLQREIIERMRWYVVQSEHVAHAFARRHGLHPTDMAALIAVMDAEAGGAPLTAGALAARLRLSSAATTAVVDRLERAGHLTRDRSRTDRRRVELRYAEPAMALAAAFFRPLGERTDHIMAGFDEAELAVVLRFVDAMAHTVEAYRGDLEQ
ncbi:MarR family winged helix-turn-helix transcriptional regulator [Spirilliplanes yamanashiensis]|uniref:MarR family winged helix-turn-helix transcriptional regulator n=1 Tax=Spirilliplanes yamanashiensis TaxID=42233 RepID=UPI00194E6070|nr:MarR family transcriptional regulator [Spirilliplanes yamanashiensis]MDP9817725.1 DNA-binding MarR family transcriptional regulator [Spirilliplanes yamanashiensis]